MIEPKTRRSVEEALIRAKLREPVRLYLYPVALLQVLGALVLGVVAADWSWVLPGLGFAAATLGGAACARASVFSEAGHYEKLHQAADRMQSIVRGSAR